MNKIKLLFIFTFTLLLLNNHFCQLSKINSKPKIYNNGDTTIVYGFSVEEDFVFVSLDSNYNEINSFLIPKNEYKFTNHSQIKFICNHIYVDFYDYSKKDNENKIIRVKISKDFSSYKIYETDMKVYKNRLLKLLESNKTNTYFITEESIDIYRNFSSSSNLFLMFEKTNFMDLASMNPTFNAVKLTSDDINLYLYKEAPTLVKYEFSEEIIDDFLYFKFEKVWSVILDDGTKQVEYNSVMLNEEAKSVSIVQQNKSSSNLLKINIETGKLENTLTLYDNLTTKKLHFSHVEFIIEQNIFISLYITLNNEMVIQLFDQNLNPFGNPIKDISFKLPRTSTVQTPTGPISAPLNLYYNSYSIGNKFYFDVTGANNHFLVSIENKIVKYKIVSDKTLEKIENKHSFHSPFFIIDNDAFIIIGNLSKFVPINVKVDKLIFLNIENNSKNNYLISNTIVKDDYFPPNLPFEVFMMFNNNIGVSAFFQSPSGNQLLWFLLEDRKSYSDPFEYVLKVEQL